MSFIKQLRKRWNEQDSFICVGLDSNLDKIPDFLKEKKNPQFNFNREIIDATHDLVCAYKPQIAYYAATGTENELEMTIQFIHDTYPGIPVILDAKRGDIGSTAQMYAKEVFDRYNADAATINPFMGGDTLLPFLSRKERGVVILCKTSNPGSGDIQDLKPDGQEVYKKVAQLANDQWNKHNNIALVVGATYPEEMKAIRSLAPEIPFLVPGIGVQGGDVEKVVKYGITKDGYGLIINSSRGIIFASGGTDFAEAAREKALTLRNLISQYR